MSKIETMTAPEKAEWRAKMEVIYKRHYGKCETKKKPKEETL